MKNNSQKFILNNLESVKKSPPNINTNADMTEEVFMARCLQLAACGRLHASPNPMVGAVVVHNGRIIGEGYHRKCGEAHAEVNAIAAVKDKALLKESVLYVSLEPCSHYGKTPPCAELIIKHKIPKVVVACLDPFPEVSGRGVRMLRDAGIEVQTGVLEAEALALNKSFITCHTHKRPYIILKWAESMDGFIDKHRTDISQEAAKLSSRERLRYNHRLRTQVDAIMVGTNTALLDNPSLSVRHWAGPAPIRIYIDRKKRIPQTHHLLDGKQETWCLETSDLSEILSQLYQRKVNTLLVEGGTQLINTFIAADLWDEIEQEQTPIRLSDGVKAPDTEPVRRAAARLEKHVFGHSLTLKYYKF